MEKTKFIDDLLDFLSVSVTPLHAVDWLRKKLVLAKFKEIKTDTLVNNLLFEQGSCYFILLNNSTIMACVIGKTAGLDASAGNILIAASHTDSPAIRLREDFLISEKNYQSLSVETYGGGIWRTWLDKPLSIAGRIIHLDSDTKELKETLVKTSHPILIIPNLPIHLTTAEERSSFKIDNETQLRPIIFSKNSTQESTVMKDASLITKQFLNELFPSQFEILSHDLYCVDPDPAVLFGIDKDMINSPHIDNLVSTWSIFRALIDWKEHNTNHANVIMGIAFDHEEVGSETNIGACSSQVQFWIDQIFACLTHHANQKGKNISCDQTLMKYAYCQNSFLLSIDGAHGFNPNYPQKYQQQHCPILNKGVVIKRNMNQRYITNGLTLATLERLYKLYGKNILNNPFQNFSCRNDISCGSTIGPILSTRLGIASADIGIPQLSMHSIRETCGVSDVVDL